MMNFPTATTVRKRLPKEAFYRHLALTNALKEKFVSDVDRIMVENSFTKQTLNLTASAETKEILLLSVRLKKQEFDGKVTEAIARQNKHRLVFLLCFESRRQLALYYGKLYRTPWMEASDVHLSLHGFTLDEIWNSMVEQIALLEEDASGQNENLSIDERLDRQDRIEKLKMLISRTEAATWR